MIAYDLHDVERDTLFELTGSGYALVTSSPKAIEIDAPKELQAGVPVLPSACHALSVELGRADSGSSARASRRPRDAVSDRPVLRQYVHDDVTGITWGLLLQRAMDIIEWAFLKLLKFVLAFHSICKAM